MVTFETSLDSIKAPLVLYTFVKLQNSILIFCFWSSVNLKFFILMTDALISTKLD
jgi:hypothetical protein